MSHATMPQLHSSSSVPELKPGIYQHYKGGKYLVLTMAMLEASLEPCVVYVSLQDDPHAPSRVWVRPLDDFTASVTVNGLIKSRFTFISPTV
jgi:hypothetical protein